ncbi:MAG: hypothetical protein IJL79_00580, partial [Candidatus Methanomethylophilaceae archaeon]|nr:hypothetical protein [Candidatus Methanomethylophilaceae archaeon]
GTMLSLEEPCKVYESGALCDGPELYSLKRDVDVTTIQGNLLLTKEDKMNYTGWWYSVFPISIIERIGYPLPFFFKEDDVEYVLRSDIGRMTICGLSVWHPVPKYDPSVNYYYVRNHLSTMASHGMLNRRNIKAFISKILLEISAYRYQGAETMISGMKDFMRGPDSVYNSCRDGPFRCSMEFKDLDELRKEDDFTSEPPRCGFFLRLITMNGLLLPSKGCTEKEARDMETKDFYRMGKILYSIGNGKGFIAVRKRTRTISLVLKTLSLWSRLSVRKGGLSKRYVDALKRYSTEDSWKKLLEMDHS